MKKVFKVVLIILLIILIILGILFSLKQFNNEPKDKETNIFENYPNYVIDNFDDYKKFKELNNDLKNADIIDFINFCKSNNIDYTKEKDLIKLYNLDNFNIDNRNEYLEFIDKNGDEDLDFVIKTINDSNELYMSLVNEKYYKYQNLKRYLNYYSENPNLNSKEVITNVNSNLDSNFYENYESTDLEKDTLMIVNKHYKLESDYVPNNLITIGPDYGYALNLRSDVYEKFIDMYNAALSDGVSLFITSPYRSYNDQNYIYNSYASRDGYERADTYSARLGFSEHQTGLAMDITSGAYLDLDSFAATPSFTWMLENAHKFGFILRYPKDKEYITGYIYEPWHYRYVGVEAATIIKNEDLTFEEYYEYYVK